MELEAASNEDDRHHCRGSLSKGRYPRLAVTLLLLLLPLMTTTLSRRIRVHSKPVAMVTVAMVAVTQTSSAAASRGAADSQPVTLGRRDASLPRRRGGPDRHRSPPSLIALRRPHGLAGGPGSRAPVLAWPPVVNKVRRERTAAVATTPVAGRTQPAAAAAGVNAAPVIMAPRRLDRPLPRIRIRSSSRPQGDPDNNYLRVSNSSNAVGNRSEVHISGDSVQRNATNLTPTDSSNGEADTDDADRYLGTGENTVGLGLAEGGVLRRVKRQSDDTVSAAKEDVRADAPSRSADGVSEEMAETGKEIPVPLGAAALVYRSRGNFAALVDPLQSSRALAAAKQRYQMVTAADNQTSPLLLTEATTSNSVASNSSVSDSDSVDVVVQKADIDAENSTSVPTVLPGDARHEFSSVSLAQPLDDGRNATVVPSAELNCNVSAIRGLHAALRLHMPVSAVALCAYTVSFLFALVATSAITSLVLSLCVRLADRRSSFQLVPGLVAIAAASRALYYVDVEYRLIAAATAGRRRALYECWYPLLIAAFFVHRRHIEAEAPASHEDRRPSTTVDRHIKRSSVRCELCFSSIALCCYIALVPSLCLLVQFCVVAVVDPSFVLRLLFSLFGVVLSALHLRPVTAFSGVRHVAPAQVVLCALFVVCAGFSAADAATLLSTDFDSLLRQNSAVLVAVEAAETLIEVSTAVALCAGTWSTLSSFQCKWAEKEGVGEHTQVSDSSKKAAQNRASSKSPQTHKWWLSRLLMCTSTSKVVDVPQKTPGTVGSAVGWTSTEEDPGNVDGLSALPSRMVRSRSMLYNDHGFIRFRVDGDTDGESDARTLDDDDGGPGPPRSVSASEYASADDLSSRRGPSSVGTPRWSRGGSPGLGGFRAPSIHLQDSIDRALDRCDIWRVGREQGRLSVEELRRIVQLYADVHDHRRAVQQRKGAGITSTNYAEV